MSGPRILIADGNVAQMRARQKAAVGYDSGSGYARVLALILPDLACDVVYPADRDRVVLPGTSLADYDGVAMTGSALNVYQGTPEVTRQIALTAAGGRVCPNPLGREFGFARRICLTRAGSEHALFAGKPVVFEAPTVHRDSIEALPPGAKPLAENDMGLQAAAFISARGTFWGLQYHPEYDYLDLAAAADRYGATLVDEGLFRNKNALEEFIAELKSLNTDPQDRALLWKHGLGAAMQSERLKLAELRNWIEAQVFPRFRRTR